MEIVTWTIIYTAFVPWVSYCYIWLFLQLKLNIGRFSIRLGEIPKLCLLLFLISPFVAVAMVGICIEDLTDFIKENR